MLAEEQIIKRIHSAGQIGAKKSDLRKEFAQPEIDNILEKLTNEGQIFIEKKGTTYYCWLKDNYLQYLLNSDPRFRLTHEAICSLERSIDKNTDRLAITLDVITARTSESSGQNDTMKATKNSRITNMGLDVFKNMFDDSIPHFSSSIGWVELGKVRNELCNKNDLSNEEFYDLVGQLMAKYPDKYELSSGGHEGVMVRGLLHGFVRCI